MAALEQKQRDYLRQNTVFSDSEVNHLLRLFERAAKSSQQGQPQQQQQQQRNEQGGSFSFPRQI